ncbi:tetratricopeptide repeat protein [Entomospira culicis]|uniref:Tetratricopeptide repeat protein n=1 Tax=Entomospira culicis TaxID=2719989 RepID=A0A968GGV4_9SPIO|nr:tetratricopeptide repeat protein [Entomospira culicis]NIZ18543.1 tetratricopeptide repeat protein [Entomospira culicis]NIZ68759.1 tetratricopeptide repeat protein [Entomospira culicis]WDI37355.1 tetratricopeptide repeat protein [Entomospira culicis]WDI38984.1 tetratricopeptide repeat protein [Entomospira culicis]
MKKVLLIILAMGFGWSATAQTSVPRGRITQSSQSYQLESDLDESQTSAIAVQLEASLRLFQQYFDNETADWPFRVRIFANHSSYLAALSTFPAEFDLSNREDFLFLLNAKRPEMSVLFVYPRADEDAMRASLLKNGFLQYLFAVAPEMSSWLREGLALYFEIATLSEDGSGFAVRENHLYLDRLQLVRTDRALTLSELLSLDDEAFEDNLESALAHSWAVVNYLMNEHNATMRMIITRELTGRGNNHSELIGLTSDIEQYFSRPGFNLLMEQGRDAIAQEDYAGALELFTQASKVMPNLWSAYYYMGLVSFHLEDFDRALEFYNESLALGASEALINYALGMLAMEQEDYGLAQSYFDLAEEGDRARFGRHVAEQRRKMESMQELQ